MVARIVVAIIAVIAIAAGLFELRAASEGLRITRTKAGETPVTIFQPELKASAPAVVIAHGFAGSQQLMQPFAEMLARNGYIAETFDFLAQQYGMPVNTIKTWIRRALLETRVSFRQADAARPEATGSAHAALTESLCLA